MRDFEALKSSLRRLDGRSYGGYKQLKGAWVGDGLTVAIDHVQGDPFAAPSVVRLIVPQAVHGIPPAWRSSRLRRMAITDFLLRVFADACNRVSRHIGSGRSGEISIDAGDAEILERSGCEFVEDSLEVRFRVGLPARGRRVLGNAAADLLTSMLPEAAQAVRFGSLDQARANRFIAIVEDHAKLQQELADRDLVAFVADGSVLPRASGVSSRPMADAVPFSAPEKLRVTLRTEHHGDVTGMGIPKGITLITGGGFHGKTTLLEAIQNGVYPHVPGDGREQVVAVPSAVKVRSEDGRSVAGVDLRPFIKDLPGQHSTRHFSTEDASGSTSLAAAVVEALEMKATVLLLDEDTCATNLLIRDARMQALVKRETITPLIDRVQSLHRHHGVSTVLVVGGNGDYLEVADTVILLEAYRPAEVSDQARAVVAEHPTGREVVEPAARLELEPRRPDLGSFGQTRGRRPKTRARGLRELQFGDETIELGALEQLVDESQVRTLGALLNWLSRNGVERQSVLELVGDGLEAVTQRGLYGIEPRPELAAVRPLELAAALNRIRGLRVHRASPRDSTND